VRQTTQPEKQSLPRIPLFPLDDMSAEHKRVCDAVINGPRGKLQGPLRAALHRPELADKWQQLGELLRYRTSLPEPLKELAILVTGRHCHAQVEWYVHAQMAAKAGLTQSIIDDVYAGRRPAAASADELAIYDYAEELNRRNTVGDATYKRVLEKFGVVGVVELTALVGYYTMVAMTLNCHDIPLPDGVAPPLPPAP
jgi:4-carboxymuconolactone decarboxylase